MNDQWSEGVIEQRDAILARYPDRVFGKVKVQRSLDFTYDGSGQYKWQGQITSVKDCGWAFTMDHQCDEFEIGDIEDAQKLIADLQRAVKYANSRH